LRSRRLAYAVVLAIIIASGLLVRWPALGLSFGLPWPVAKWSGSILWGAMVYVVIALIRPGGRLGFKVCVAVAIAFLVEFSRLYHAPWIDDFRRTTGGALLLGRLFSPLNILAYLIGIAVATAAEWRWQARS
jgi:hypothetical protein